MTDPSGPIGLPEGYVRLMLADCAAFRTWVGAANQAEALAHIYTDKLPDPGANRAEYTKAELEGYRPFALVWTDPDMGGSEPIDAGSPPTYRHSGRVWIHFEQDVDPEIAADAYEISVQFKNTLGAIQLGMEALAGAGYLARPKFGPFGGVHRTHPKVFGTFGDCIQAEQYLDWSD